MNGVGGHIAPEAVGGRGETVHVKVVTAADSPYDVAADDHFLLCNTANGSITLNLPAIDSSAPRLLVIKRDGANGVTMDPDGTEQIEGASSRSLGTDGDSEIIAPANGEWKVWANF